MNRLFAAPMASEPFSFSRVLRCRRTRPLFVAIDSKAFFLYDYHQTSVGEEYGALYFFKLDSGGVSGMSGGYGLIVPTG
jgi:hypothetical protein